MIINISVFHEIKRTIGQRIPECGGIIGKKRNTICSFSFDGEGEYSHYTPNIDKVNKAIAFWAGLGIEFAGFVHSHPNRNRRLSNEDKLYINEIIKSNPDNSRFPLYFPIILPCDDTNEFTIVGYKATERHGTTTITNEDIILRN